MEIEKQEEKAAKRIICDRISCPTKSKTAFGQFTLSSSDGISWQGPGGSNKINVSFSKITRVLWSKLGKHASLHLFYSKSNPTVNDSSDKNDEEEENDESQEFYERFDNFDPKFQTNIQSECADHNVEFEQEKINSRGLNGGKMEIDQVRNELQFTLEDKYLMGISLKDISQSAAPAKNELEIQFKTDDTGARDDEQLVEMRLYVPPEKRESGENEEEEEVDAAPVWHQRILDIAGIRGVTGDLLCTFEDNIGKFLIPHGKYKMEIYGNFFRMIGKTYEYKVPYNTITRMFLLPKQDEIHKLVCISLRDPIRQGQQSYPHLVLQIDNRKDTFEFSCTEEKFKEKHLDQQSLTMKMTDTLPNIVAKILKGVSNQKMFVPGTFESYAKFKCIKCSLKANEGLLYPLNKSFFFVHKPAIYITFDEIDHVEFERVSSEYSNGESTRSFDFKIVLKDSSGDKSEEIRFSSISKEEFEPFLAFLEKRVTVKSLSKFMAKKNKGLMDDGAGDLGDEGGDGGEESPDSDFDESDDSDDNDESEDSDDDSDSGAEMVEEDFPNQKKPKKDPKKDEDTSSKPKEKSSSDAKAKSGDDEGKKKKPSKDPNAPKKPSTAYLFFSNDKRNELKEQGLSFTEIGEKLGELWKAVSDEEKKKYEALAAKDKERYTEEMSKYVPAPGFETKPKKESKKRPHEEADGGGEGKKSKKDPNAPKKPSTAYLFFSNDKRGELKSQGLSFKEIGTKLGEMWKVVSEEEKKKYEELAGKDKERYNEEKAKYVPPPGYENKPKKKQKTAGDDKEKAEKKKKDPNAPKKPSTSYLFFSNEKRGELKSQGVNQNEIPAKLGEMWKALSDEQKKPYVQKQAEDKARYEKEMKTYVPPQEISESESSSSEEEEGDENNNEGSGSGSGSGSESSSEEGDE